MTVLTYPLKKRHACFQIGFYLKRITFFFIEAAKEPYIKERQDIGEKTHLYCSKIKLCHFYTSPSFSLISPPTYYLTYLSIKLYYVCIYLLFSCYCRVILKTSLHNYFFPGYVYRLSEFSTLFLSPLSLHLSLALSLSLYISPLSMHPYISIKSLKMIKKI